MSQGTVITRKICSLAIVFQLFVGPVYSQEHNPLRKLARGAANIALCWVEVPRQMLHVTAGESEKVTNDVAGAFWGPVKGLSYCVGRLFLGVYETATFLIPPYKNLVSPEFIFTEEEGVE